MNKWHFIHWKMFSGNEYFQENEWKCDNIIGIFIVVVVVVLVGISLLFLQKGLIFIGILRRHREKLCFYRKMETGFPSKLIIRMISSHGSVLRISFRAKKTQTIRLVEKATNSQNIDEIFMCIECQNHTKLFKLFFFLLLFAFSCLLLTQFVALSKFETNLLCHRSIE